MRGLLAEASAPNKLDDEELKLRYAGPRNFLKHVGFSERRGKGVSGVRTAVNGRSRSISGVRQMV